MHPLLRKKSPFQKRVENVMRFEFGGGFNLLGLQHTLILIRHASGEEIDSLHPDYSPIPMAMKCVYVQDNYEQLLFDIIQACESRGIKINGGDCLDGCFERPLVLAAALGKLSWFTCLLQFGAAPNEMDGRGRNALRAAYDKRDTTKRWFPLHMKDEHRRSLLFQRRRFRSSPVEISFKLLQNQMITDSLHEARNNHGFVYIDQNSPCGSPLLAAILHGPKFNEIRCLVRLCGATLTDQDYLIILKANKLKNLNRAVQLLSPQLNDAPKGKRKRESNSTASPRSSLCFSPSSSWSFPPTYRVAIALTKQLGMPEDIFRDHLQPFLTRDWFFTKEQLEAPTLTEEMISKFQQFKSSSFLCS